MRKVKKKRLIDLDYYCKLYKDAFNIKDKNTLKLRDNKIKVKFFGFFFIILACVTASVFLSDEKQVLYDLFEFINSFFSITIGFTITSLVFLVGDFTRFKTALSKDLEVEVIEGLCKQLSATLLLSIYSNILTIILGMLNNFLFHSIAFKVSSFLILIINYIYLFIIYSLVGLSLFLLLRSLRFLKKYIDFAIKL